MNGDVRAAYAARATEYAELLGAMDFVHPADAATVGYWADTVTGTVLDVGCGPGHWSDFLARRGVEVRGVDQVPEFITHAREVYPSVGFDLAEIEAMPFDDGSIGGVLAWYSLIHHEPSTIRSALAEIARVLRPGGSVLVGFFTGERLEPFDHAVTTAYRWPVASFEDALRATGFVVLETSTRTVAGDRPRPHGAIEARLGR